MTALLLRLGVLIVAFAVVFLLSQLYLQSRFNRGAERKAVNRRLELLKSGATTEDVGDILRKGVPDRLPPNATFTQRLWYRFQRMVRLANVRIEPPALALGCAMGFAATFALILSLASPTKDR